jgi:hypothetical protein
MWIFKPIAQAALLALGVVMFAPGCVIEEPREGYYDHERHRWYHEHAWRECREEDEHCRR